MKPLAIALQETWLVKKSFLFTLRNYNVYHMLGDHHRTTPGQGLSVMIHQEVPSFEIKGIPSILLPIKLPTIGPSGLIFASCYFPSKSSKLISINQCLRYLNNADVSVPFILAGDFNYCSVSLSRKLQRFCPSFQLLRCSGSSKSHFSSGPMDQWKDLDHFIVNQAALHLLSDHYTVDRTNSMSDHWPI